MIVNKSLPTMFGLLGSALVGVGYYGLSPKILTKFAELGQAGLKTQIKAFAVSSLAQAIFLLNYDPLADKNISRKFLENLLPYLLIGGSVHYFHRNALKANIIGSSILGSALVLTRQLQISSMSKGIILAALTEDGMMLRFASKAFKNDKDVVRAAVSQDHYRALQFASEALKNDREFILGLIRHDGRTFQFASEALKNNREFVLEAVTQNGGAFEFVSEVFKNKEVALTAITQLASALRFVPEALKNDKDVIQAAFQADREWFDLFASENEKHILFTRD